MSSVALWTYKDAVDHAIDFLGADVSNEAARVAKRAVLAAYLEIANAHRWSYLYQRGRVTTVEPYATGTVAFDYTGGTYERMLTLTDGTWPEWAPYGVVVIGQTAYEVADRKSSAVLTLASHGNPGEDIDAGTSYTLYRDTYPLPSDFIAADEVIAIGQIACLTYQHPREWVNRQRIIQSPAVPNVYTVMGDQNYFGTLALKLFPAPDDAYQLDFIYQRRPRQLSLEEYSTGTVTVAADAVTVTGSGTTFTSAMVGSVIRLSDDSTNKPTGVVGSEPAAQERVVMSYTSATEVSVDTAFDQTLTGVKFVISNPLDLEEGAMLTAFWRCVEKELGVLRKMKDRDELFNLYRQALILAREADSRSFQPRAAGMASGMPYRLRDFPAGADD